MQRATGEVDEQPDADRARELQRDSGLEQVDAEGEERHADGKDDEANAWEQGERRMDKGA